eukprot:NODE_3137_length_593_cov_131.154412_g2625_i0.p1 GENE.NODE_3137_length_593_cov_131.154412_g2625_i0~~NODE_3137_length_593_cov_131.154412_g2625_i0.p1  ORF type:complete len:94 (-),score=11.57 NODE_3137_length_593_cov_131.154412_g2625_i0:165-446(-)
MNRTPCLLRMLPVVSSRLGRSQGWKTNHFPNPLNKRYGVVENLKYLELIDDLNCRFGLIGEEPRIEIGREGAYIYLRHWMDPTKQRAVEVAFY